MIKKINLLLILSANLLFAEAVNLGVSGNLYEIPEENFKITIEKAVDELDLNETKIKETVLNGVKEQAFGTTNLPFGKKVEAYESDNYQIIGKDIFNPLGRLIYKKGDKVLMKTYSPLDLCFVDGSNLVSLKNQIEYFDKVVKKKSNTECTYMVSNRSVLELNKEYYPRLFYPARPAYERRFLIKSIPSYVHIEGSKKLVYSFPIDMFKSEVKTNEK